MTAARRRRLDPVFRRMVHYVAGLEPPRTAAAARELRCAPLLTTWDVVCAAARDLGDAPPRLARWSVADCDALLRRWARACGYDDDLCALVEPQLLCAAAHEAPRLVSRAGLTTGSADCAPEGGPLAGWEVVALAVRLAQRAAVLDAHTGRLRAPAPARACCARHAGTYFSTDADAVHPCVCCGFSLMPPRLFHDDSVPCCSAACSRLARELLPRGPPAAAVCCTADLRADCTSDTHTAAARLHFAGRFTHPQTGLLLASRVTLAPDGARPRRDVGHVRGVFAASPRGLTARGRALLQRAWSEPLEGELPTELAEDDRGRNNEAVAVAVNRVCTEGFMDCGGGAACAACQEAARRLETRTASPRFHRALAHPRLFPLPHVARMALLAPVDVCATAALASALPHPDADPRALGALLKRGRLDAGPLLAALARPGFYDALSPALEFADRALLVPGPWTTDTGSLLRDCCPVARMDSVFRHVVSSGVARPHAGQRRVSLGAVCEQPRGGVCVSSRTSGKAVQRLARGVVSRVHALEDLLRVDAWLGRAARDCAFSLGRQMCASGEMPRASAPLFDLTPGEAAAARRDAARIPAEAAGREAAVRTVVLFLHLLEQKVFVTGALVTYVRVLARDHGLGVEHALAVGRRACAPDRGLERRLRRNVALSVEFDDLLERALDRGGVGGRYLLGEGRLAVLAAGTLPAEDPWAHAEAPALDLVQSPPAGVGAAVVERLRRMGVAERGRALWSRDWSRAPAPSEDRDALDAFHASRVQHVRQRQRRAKHRAQLLAALRAAEEWLRAPPGSAEALAGEQRWRAALEGLLKKALDREALLAALAQQDGEQFRACHEVAASAALVLELAPEARGCTYFWKRAPCARPRLCAR